MYTIKCVICGKEFDAKRPHAKYCNRCKRTAHTQYELNRNRGIRAQADQDAQQEQIDAHKKWLLEEERKRKQFEKEYEREERENPTAVYDYYIQWRNERIEADKESGYESDWSVGGVHIYSPNYEEELKEMLIEQGLLKGEIADNGK